MRPVNAAAQLQRCLARQLLESADSLTKAASVLADVIKLYR
jgi:hypothetical protein